MGEILKNLEVYSVECFDSHYNRWIRISDRYTLEEAILTKDKVKKYDRKPQEYRILKKTIKEEVVG